MRILVIVYEFPPVGGGGGVVARDIATGLAKRGHQVQVLSSHFNKLPRQETRNGIHIVRVPSARKSPYQASFPSMAAFVLAGSVAGLRLVRRFQPDLIHVHFAVPSGPVAWLLSRWYKVPYVLTVHLGDVPGGVPEKTDKWFRWIFPFTPPIWRDAAQVVAVSEHTRQLALRHYPVNIKVIPNGTNLSEFATLEIRLNQPPLILFVGRFVPQKDPLTFVHTLAAIKNLPWRAQMLGDGPLRPQVEACIYAERLEDRIELLGWVPPEQVIQAFCKADILFMPSLSEGLPVVGVQAIAAGLAIVASRVGGYVDIVDPGYNGYLLSPQDQHGFAQTLQTILSSPEKLLELRQSSRQKARAFDLEKVVEAYESFLQQAVTKHKKPL